MCVMWLVTFPHPVLHIPLIWNVGQALHLGSTGNEGSSTPARLALRVMSFISPACQKMLHIPSTYALLYTMALGSSSSPALPPHGPPPPRPGFAPTPPPPLRLDSSVFKVSAPVDVAVTAGAVEVSNGGHRAVWFSTGVGRELMPPP